MNVSTLTFEREYSGLVQLQRACRIIYALQCCDAQNSFLVSVTAVCRSAAEEEAQAAFAADAATAKNVLLYLYENGVTPALLSDVLSDLKAQGIIEL